MVEISVIIPCYNVEKYIDDCVRSLVHQTLPLEQMEFIFVDDASTDGTLERLREWEKQYPENILLITCEKNGKQGTARNIGMSYARGDYIGFLDSDDWVEPVMYGEMLRKAKEYQCDLVTCHMFRNHADGTVTREHLEKEDSYLCYEKSVAEGGKIWPEKMGGGGVYCKIYRKNFLLEYQICFPDGMIYEDNYFALLVRVYVKSIYNIEHCYYHYRENETSTLFLRNDYRLFDRMDIEIMKLEKLKELGLFEKFHERIEKSFFRLYYFNTMTLMATRFDIPPYAVFQRMEREIETYFPDWQERTAWISGGDELNQVLLKILTCHFSEERFLWFMKRLLE